MTIPISAVAAFTARRVLERRADRKRALDGERGRSSTQAGSGLRGESIAS